MAIEVISEITPKNHG
jgi:hypothetical protein